MSYLHDLFLSYSRKEPVLRWVRYFFRPVLEEWLRESMGEEPHIFRDEESLATGTTWPLALQQGLHRSRVIVAVLSPSYTRSPWCCAEWSSFRHRERQLGLRTQAIPGGLIYPVCFHNCASLPTDFRDIQHKDLSPWNLAYPAFRDSTPYGDFLSVMQGIANELAALIQSVPAWQDDFPILLPETAEGIRKVAMEVPRL
jgi:TIR domain